MFHLGANKPYIFMVLCLSMLSYVLAGVQFWMSDYCIEALHSDATTAFTGFAIICITGPALGSVIAGYQIANLGGYTSMKTFYFALGSAIFLCFTAVPIPILNHMLPVLVMLFFALAGGGILQVTCTGLMLSQVAPSLRPKANALAAFFFNVLGYLPAPYIYGLVAQATTSSELVDGKPVYSRWGLVVTLSMTVPAAMFLGVAMICKARQLSVDASDNFQQDQ